MGAFNRRKYKSGELALNKDEIKKLLDAITDIHYKALIALDIVTGLRRNDIVSLRRENYNPDDCIISFYEHKKDAMRTINVPSEYVISLLNEHLELCRQSEWLFPSPKATGCYENAHVSPRQAYDVFNEYLELAGLERRPFHALRATCYQLALDSDWNMSQSSEQLGITLRVAECHYNDSDALSVGEMQNLCVEKPLF